MTRIEGPLDPSSPEEYIEAVMRVCETAMDIWEELPDGDGETSAPNDENQTKTDMFQVIRGCASYGLDCLKMKHQVNQI